MQLLVGITFMIAGLVLFILVDRRQMYRKNSAGVSEYDSYLKYILTTVIEFFIKAAGTILTLSGFFLILKYFV